MGNWADDMDRAQEQHPELFGMYIDDMGNPAPIDDYLPSKKHGQFTATPQHERTHDLYCPCMKAENNSRLMLHTFFALENLGNCSGTDHRADNNALCARAARWVS